MEKNILICLALTVSMSVNVLGGVITQKMSMIDPATELSVADNSLIQVDPPMLPAVMSPYDLRVDDTGVTTTEMTVQTLMERVASLMRIVTSLRDMSQQAQELGSVVQKEILGLPPNASLPMPFGPMTPFGPFPYDRPMPMEQFPNEMNYAMTMNGPDGSRPLDMGMSDMSDGVVTTSITNTKGMTGVQGQPSPMFRPPVMGGQMPRTGGPMQGQMQVMGAPMQGQMPRTGGPMQGQMQVMGGPMQGQMPRTGAPMQGNAMAPMQGQVQRLGAPMQANAMGPMQRNPMMQASAPMQANRMGQMQGPVNYPVNRPMPMQYPMAMQAGGMMQGFPRSQVMPGVKTAQVQPQVKMVPTTTVKPMVKIPLAQG